MVYNGVKELGLKDEDIVLMIADDAAFSPRNSKPGKIFADAGHRRNLLRPGTEVDYFGDEVDARALFRVLSGRHPAGTPAHKRLHLRNDTHLLLYMAGHGGDGFLKFQDADPAHTTRLRAAFADMHARGRYASALVLVDTCQAGTVVEAFDAESTPCVVGVGSSGRGENSFSRGASRELNTHLVDRFTERLGHWLTHGARNTEAPTSLAGLLRLFPRERLLSQLYVNAAPACEPLDAIPARRFFAPPAAVEAGAPTPTAGRADVVLAAPTSRDGGALFPSVPATDDAHNCAWSSSASRCPARAGGAATYASGGVPRGVLACLTSALRDLAVSPDAADAAPAAVARCLHPPVSAWAVACAAASVAMLVSVAGHWTSRGSSADERARGRRRQLPTLPRPCVFECAGVRVVWTPVGLSGLLGGAGALETAQRCVREAEEVARDFAAQVVVFPGTPIPPGVDLGGRLPLTAAPRLCGPEEAVAAAVAVHLLPPALAASAGALAAAHTRAIAEASLCVPGLSVSVAPEETTAVATVSVLLSGSSEPTVVTVVPVKAGGRRLVEGARRALGKAPVGVAKGGWAVAVGPRVREPGSLVEEEEEGRAAPSLRVGAVTREAVVLWRADGRADTRLGVEVWAALDGWARQCGSEGPASAQAADELSLRWNRWMLPGATVGVSTRPLRGSDGTVDDTAMEIALAAVELTE